MPDNGQTPKVTMDIQGEHLAIGGFAILGIMALLTIIAVVIFGKGDVDKIVLALMNMLTAAVTGIGSVCGMNLKNKINGG